MQRAQHAQKLASWSIGFFFSLILPLLFLPVCKFLPAASGLQLIPC